MPSARPDPAPVQALRQGSISVVLPLYQGEATIERAIASVQAQTVPATQIIVVDDGSTDSGAARVRAIDDARIVLIEQHNAGSGAARNVGIRLATGTFMAFLDADDEWLPDFFERATLAFENHPQVDFYFGDSVELGLDTGVGARAPGYALGRVTDAAGENPVKRIDPPLSGNGKTLKRRIDQSLCTMVARRERLLDLGGYYDRDGCRYGEDSVLALLIHWNHPILHQRIAVHLRHRLDSGLTRSNQREPLVRPLVSDTPYVLERIDPTARPLARRLIAYLAALDASRLAKAGRVQAAWQVLVSALRLSDLSHGELVLPLARFALRAIGLGRKRRRSSPSP